MKKRLISMLLAVLMVTSLFGGMSVSAFADGDYKTTTYTMAQGDTVLQICNKLGLNYYSCKTAIEKLNNITSDAQYRKLSVGQVLTLPASDADAVKIAQANVGNGGSNGGSIIGGGNNGSNGGSGNVGNANVAYWLIPYTMQRGETVTGVCNTLGINFSAYADQIKSLNKISSWNKVAAGKTLLLPSAVSPSAGISCYAVVAHYVSRGETAYGICQNYGIGYNANSALLQGLNPRVSLTNIKANTTLLVPVPTVITSGGGNNGGTVIPPSNGSNGGNNGGSGDNNNNGGNNGSTGKVYKLTAGTVTGGKVTFSVNGKTTTSAAAGSKVLIKVSPESGKGLESLSLIYADGSAVPTIKDGTFTMPECDVRVNAKFSGGYYMGPISAHGSVTLYNNDSNVITSTAAKGAEIRVVVSPATGYEISRIYIQRNDGSGKIHKDNMKSGDTFTMPDCPVFVRVDYASKATYKISAPNGTSTWNGSFSWTVKGSQVDRAAAGATVEVVPNPASGYMVGEIIVKQASTGKDISVSENRFIMPPSDVTIEVSFKEGTDTKYSIKVESTSVGRAEALLNGKPVTEAKAGETITFNDYPADGYVIDYYTAKDANGATMKIEADGSFTMQSRDVTITPVFKSNVATLVIENGANGAVTVTRGNDTLKNGDTVKVGDVLEVSAAANEGYTAKLNVNGTTGTDNVTYTVKDGGAAVKVVASYEANSYTLSVDANWIGFFDLVIGSERKDVTSTSETFQVATGTKIDVELKAGRDNFKITGINIDGVDYMGKTSMTMPAGDATIMVLIEEVAPVSEASDLADLPVDALAVLPE